MNGGTQPFRTSPLPECNLEVPINFKHRCLRFRHAGIVMPMSHVWMFRIMVFKARYALECKPCAQWPTEAYQDQHQLSVFKTPQAYKAAKGQPVESHHTYQIASLSGCSSRAQGDPPMRHSAGTERPQWSCTTTKLYARVTVSTGAANWDRMPLSCVFADIARGWPLHMVQDKNRSGIS